MYFIFPSEKLKKIINMHVPGAIYPKVHSTETDCTEHNAELDNLPHKQSLYSYARITNDFCTAVRSISI